MRKQAPTLVEMNAFVVVAERLNFSKASSQLGISTGTLSQTLRTLEERLGVRLLNRTTRSVSLTDVGQNLLTAIKPVLHDYGAVIDTINNVREKPAGNLRLHVAQGAAGDIVTPVLPRFIKKYPDINIEVSRDSSEIDFVASHFDAGIHYREFIDGDMVLVRVSAPIRMAVVGAPEYFAAHPRPIRAPSDLRDHNCIRFRAANGTLRSWRFSNGGVMSELGVGGTIIVNDRDLLMGAALNGVGLAYVVLTPEVQAMVNEKKLIPVLQDWTYQSEGFFFYYPNQGHAPAQVRLLADFLRCEFGDAQV